MAKIVRGVRKMQLFLDTANSKEIKKWYETGLIDGITTNPTHLAKEGGNPKDKVVEICRMMPECPISVEVTEKEPEAVYKQAKEIAQLADNIVVKIPCHRDYYPVIHRLVEEEIPLNITLVFSLIQSLLMCKLGVHYISPFIGRLEDIDVNGIELIADIRAMIDEYAYTTELLAASIRSVDHVHEVIKAGADVATVPVEIMQKMTSHPLTDKGMAQFLADWQKLGITTFP